MGNIADEFDGWQDYVVFESIPEPDDFEIYLEEIADELISLLLKKHKDYGPLNISNSPGGAINGLRVRMHDKLARINNLYDNARDFAPENESFEDSFKDMANYAIIGLMVLRGRWKKDEDIRTVQGE